MRHGVGEGGCRIGVEMVVGLTAEEWRCILIECAVHCVRSTAGICVVYVGGGLWCRY